MATTTASIEINGKPLKVLTTPGYRGICGDLETVYYVNTVLNDPKPVDMYVFETHESQMSIRRAGYFLDGSGMDEEAVISKCQSLPTDKFWFKLDDHGDFYVGTFLLPEEY